MKNGFTLIELLIVTTLSIMLMLTAAALFTTFLISNNRTDSSQLVKSNGEYALGQMEFLLRNAIELLPNSQAETCTAGMTEITFRSVDDGTTTLFQEEDQNGIARIASNSGQFITSESVELVSGLTFDCVESPDKVQQYITISFTLQKAATSFGNDEVDVQQTFTTGVNIRTF
ncbi:MAG TPA: type II secretion system protein [Patescibacteria group bacterium]